jgi:hypothetical protein
VPCSHEYTPLKVAYYGGKKKVEEYLRSIGAPEGGFDSGGA